MNRDEILQELAHLRTLLANYEELGSEMDEPEYMARGNGFCDAKYSEDFLLRQMGNIKQRINQLEKILS